MLETVKDIVSIVASVVCIAAVVWLSVQIARSRPRPDDPDPADYWKG